LSFTLSLRRRRPERPAPSFGGAPAAISTAGLGDVERRIGKSNELVDARLLAVGQCGDANAHGHRDRIVSMRELSTIDDPPHALGEGQRLVARDTSREDCELLPSVAREYVFCAERLFDFGGELPQD